MADNPSDCHMIKDIVPGFDRLKIKARVNRMWGVPDPISAFGFVSVEMVLADAQGCKIQATITREFIRAFQRNIVEDRVYYFKYLCVVPNVGTYKETRHMYKLLFQRRTQVVDAGADLTTDFGLSPMTNWQLVNYKGYFEYLVDFVGAITAVSCVKECVQGGTTRKYISMEIADDTGVIELSLYDEYVPYVKEYMRCFGRAKPIIVVQYARIVPAAGQLFGNFLIQNYYTATRLIFNGTLPEIVEFKNRMCALGLVVDGTLIVKKESGNKPTLRDDFLALNGKRAVTELAAAKECGVYIVLATIVNIMEDGKWWYYSCKCKRTVMLDGEVFYCPGCCKKVVNVTPRYKIIVKVFDGLCDACFALSDEDLQYLVHKSCKELMDEVEDPTSERVPDIFMALIGKRLLFKVETKCHPPCNFQRVFPVSRVCDDAEMIGEFLKGDTLENREKACDEFNFFPLVPVGKGKEVVVYDGKEEVVHTGVPVKRSFLPDDPFDFFGDLRSVNRRLDTGGASSSFNDPSTTHEETGSHVADLTLRI